MFDACYLKSSDNWGGGGICFQSCHAWKTSSQYYSVNNSCWYCRSAPPRSLPVCFLGVKGESRYIRLGMSDMPIALGFMPWKASVIHEQKIYSFMSALVPFIGCYFVFGFFLPVLPGSGLGVLLNRCYRQPLLIIWKWNRRWNQTFWFWAICDKIHCNPFSQPLTQGSMPAEVRKCFRLMPERKERRRRESSTTEAYTANGVWQVSFVSMCRASGSTGKRIPKDTRIN